MKKSSNSQHYPRFDFRSWFQRWEAMQDGYIPKRQARFRLMLGYPGLPKNARLNLLDLGCGPGSLSFCALDHFSNAHSVAVDSDPVLLKIGRGVSENLSRRIQFIRADLRKRIFWESLDRKFDLVLSATALHWLSAGHLSQVYEHVFQVLKPGGWFMNSDHIAHDNPNTQACFRKALRSRQKKFFSRSRVDDWEGFWTKLRAELKNTGVIKTRARQTVWEGDDDGQPRQFQISALKASGFSEVKIIWRDLGEAVIAARK
jgi:SAM-dependent methyltransferase